MRKQGRPLKTINDLPQGWWDTVLRLAREGAPDERIQTALGISDGTWRRLLHDSPEFWSHIKRAREIKFVVTSTAT